MCIYTDFIVEGFSVDLCKVLYIVDAFTCV